ncbi:hypothetical protein FHS82_001096 [Pseudochelatococcus lubricantis]|uniref:Uncharacterized protein n=1 Tax=Pseudochelatococcus lubricantis TaxID=1538102 RepID=A0ABX0UZF4_9HYPH|nr:hypothetical protein [Pseudochelatococcus lubricantis]NIJ57270.1 hypothetical protein [Pseudochelatococcus lubricantis]
MTINYTDTADGKVLAADNGTFYWHRLNDGNVYEIATKRTIYLSTGGYARQEGFGTDPAPVDVVEAARSFAREVAAEDQCRAKADQDAERRRSADIDAALSIIPQGARDELDRVNAEWRRRADAVNEGGEGYAHVVGWSDHTGKEILAKHGLTLEQIDDVTAAVDALLRAEPR